MLNGARTNKTHVVAVNARCAGQARTPRAAVVQTAVSSAEIVLLSHSIRPSHEG